MNKEQIKRKLLEMYLKKYITFEKLVEEWDRLERGEFPPPPVIY